MDEEPWGRQTEGGLGLSWVGESKAESQSTFSHVSLFPVAWGLGDLVFLYLAGGLAEMCHVSPSGLQDSIPIFLPLGVLLPPSMFFPTSACQGLRISLGCHMLVTSGREATAKMEEPGTVSLLPEGGPPPPLPLKIQPSALVRAVTVPS